MLLSLQVTNIDCSQYPINAHFTSLFDETASSFVSNNDHVRFPVIRIYGCSPAGQSICAHIHGVFPYLYFRPESDLDTTFNDELNIRSFIPSIVSKITELVNAERRKWYNGDYRQQKVVYRAEVAQKMSIFGYHDSPKFFVKLYAMNPGDIKIIAEILENLPQKMQCYESHIPYLLQFFQDYNIFGMSWLGSYYEYLTMCTRHCCKHKNAAYSRYISSY